MAQPILIDTDAGDDIDDVLAIAFALRRPELDVRAITTVSPGARQRAGLMVRLLEAAGHAAIPVAAGSELPLVPLNTERLAHITDLKRVLNHAGPEVTRHDFTLSNLDAVNQIIHTVEAHAGEIGIVGIGPLTNIACALRARPSIAAKIKWIALMGGEVNIPRNEHNISWDYLAASIVFTSGVPLFLGTWSITRQFQILPDNCARIAAHPSNLCRFIGPLIDLWWPWRGAKPGPVMYDIAPLLWAFRPDLYPTSHRSLAVETRGEYTTGMTVDTSGNPNCHVTVSMDAAAVEDLYLTTLLAPQG